jgi:DNA-binding transcriptional LysR family regulator
LLGQHRRLRQSRREWRLHRGGASHQPVADDDQQPRSGAGGSIGRAALEPHHAQGEPDGDRPEYYERSAHILADLDEADRAAGALQATPRGRLRVHCHPSLARIIAPVVTAYLRDNPQVSVDLRRGDQMIDLLEEGFDLAIRQYVPPDSSLMVRRLADWRPVLYCSRSYLETHPEPMSPADLSAHNCIRYAFYPFGDEWRFTNPNGAPLTVRVAGNLVTSDSELLHLAAVSGLGVTLIALFNIHEGASSRFRRAAAAELPSPEFSIAAVFPHRRHLAAKVRVFIDALARLFAGRDWLNPEGARLRAETSPATRWRPHYLQHFRFPCFCLRRSQSWSA